MISYGIAVNIELSYYEIRETENEQLSVTVKSQTLKAYPTMSNQIKICSIFRNFFS